MPSALLASSRDDALQRFRATPSGRQRPGRFWKIDLESDLPLAAHDAQGAGDVSIDAPASVVACDLEHAMRAYPEQLARAMGHAIRADQKWAALTQAFVQLGAFVHIPRGVRTDEPIVIRYSIPQGSSAFPYTVVFAEAGSSATIVERIDGGAGSTICGIAEIVTEERASIAYASAQSLPDDATCYFTRATAPGADARVTLAAAELGAGLTVSDISATLAQPGIAAQIATLFFADGKQHVDIQTVVDHQVGNAESDTVVKSAASGNGQGRYLGNIRIAVDAQQSHASLRDDALLLSKSAHIDSVPALEIAANDVKAFHGATVGALDDEALFYMMTRGMTRDESERMIALGFFEPVIARFPVESLRQELRDALEAKIA